MIKNLIGIYYTFASSGVPSFNGFDIVKSNPDKVSCLKIISHDEAKMIDLDDNFGHTNFWKETEKILASKLKRSDEL